MENQLNQMKQNHTNALNALNFLNSSNCINPLSSPDPLYDAPPATPIYTIFSSQSSPESSKVDSITSSLPITECPATMKCVREDFCDAKGVMVPFRVSLTEQEKRQRGTLIVSFSSFFSIATITH